LQAHSRPHLTNRRGESKYYQEALIGKGGRMVLCPECETNLDVEEEDVDEGEVISCPECGTDFEVVTTSPLELKAVEEGYEEDEDEEEEETEDGDYS
jgi:alpha-aminoadipate carrier protein LysW